MNEELDQEKPNVESNYSVCNAEDPPAKAKNIV